MHTDSPNSQVRDNIVGANDAIDEIQPCTSVELNYDILLCVMARMDAKDYRVKDLLAMMFTCRSFYKSGLPILLRRPVYVDPSNIASFCNYMFKDLDWHGSLLRHLYLRHSASYRAVSWHLKRLSLIVKHASKLKTFSASTSERIFKYAPDMVETLITLPNLNELELWSMGHRAITLLRGSSRKLIQLSLSLLDGAQFHIPQLTLPRLEELTLHDVSFRTFQARCPSVKRLALGITGIDDWSLSDLISLFPNLRELVLRRHHTIRDLGRVQFLHEVNKRDRGSIPHPWIGLEEVEGDLANIFALAIPCSVKTLRLSETVLDQRTFNWLPTLLTGCQPKFLSLDIETSHLDLVSFANCNRLAVTAPQLSSFQIVIRICNNFDQVLNLHSFLDIVLRFISCPSLITIEIHLHADSTIRYTGHPALEALRDLGSYNFAKRVLKAVGSKSLRHICLAITGRGSSHWIVSRNGELIRGGR